MHARASTGHALHASVIAFFDAAIAWVRFAPTSSGALPDHFAGA